MNSLAAIAEKIKHEFRKAGIADSDVAGRKMEKALMSKAGISSAIDRKNIAKVRPDQAASILAYVKDPQTRISSRLEILRTIQSSIASLRQNDTHAADRAEAVLAGVISYTSMFDCTGGDLEAFRAELENRLARVSFNAPVTKQSADELIETLRKESGLTANGTKQPPAPATPLADEFQRLTGDKKTEFFRRHETAIGRELAALEKHVQTLKTRNITNQNQNMNTPPPATRRKPIPTYQEPPSHQPKPVQITAREFEAPPKAMLRSEFQKMTPAGKMAFVKAGHILIEDPK